jgi:hypothetical protein
VSLLLQISCPTASDILLVALNDEKGISKQCIVIRVNRQKIPECFSIGTFLDGYRCEWRTWNVVKELVGRGCQLK